MLNRTESQYSVCLFGAHLGSNNRGVSALTVSLAKLINTYHPDARIQLMIASHGSEPQFYNMNNKKCKLDVCNYRHNFEEGINRNILFIFFLSIVIKLVPIETIRKKIIFSNDWLHTLYNADFVGDIRGGDSFSDIYGMKRYIFGSIARIIPILMNKELVLLPQTYGPYSRSVTRKIAIWILKRSSIIMSRDTEGIDYVKELIPSSYWSKIKYCPDVAMIMEKAIVQNPFSDFDETKRLKVGINVNGLMMSRGYSASSRINLNIDYIPLLIDLISYLIRKKNAEIFLIPHTFGKPGDVNSDPQACQVVKSALESDVKVYCHLMDIEPDQNEIKGIIGFFDFFIGSRMHSCIAALSQYIPTIGIAYSKKFIGVFNSLNLGRLVIDARSESAEDIISRIDNQIDDRDNIRKTLEIEVGNAQETILNEFRSLL